MIASIASCQLSIMLLLVLDRTVAADKSLTVGHNDLFNPNFFLLRAIFNATVFYLSQAGRAGIYLSKNSFKVRLKFKPHYR